MDNKVISIKLYQKDYSDASVCEKSSLINRVQLDKMMEILTDRVNDAKVAKESSIDGRHNTISIFGNRGAGKTTFLRTALNIVKEKYADDVVVLNVIDPSKVEIKQHPFINIIAAIHECVDRCIHNDFISNNRNSHPTDYNEAYKQLLKGLPFMDGVGNDNGYNEWTDDLYISYQGMEKAEASNNLIDNFKKYIYQALKVLGKSCFVISFDDIDTNINKGFEILEVIRKYLVTEQIITILTGDLDLYSKLVRKSSWKSFDMEFLKQECEYSKRSKEEFSDMVNHLENQYLLKILKPEYRIHLKTVREVLESGFDVCVYTDEYTHESIHDCYRTFIEDLKISTKNSRSCEYIVIFLESLSIRTQLRILRLVDELIQLKKKNIVDDEKINQLSRDFVNIFWSDIKQKSLDAKSLVSESKFYTIEMMKFLVKLNLLEQCSDFMPHTDDETLNKALVAISSLFSTQANNLSFMLFDYWLRICYLKYAWYNTGGNIEKLHNIIKFSSLAEHDDLNKCIGLVSSFCRSEYKSHNMPNKTMPGTMIVENFKYHQIYNSFLDLISYGSIDGMGNSIRYVSIYKLFAVIRDFLYHKQNYTGNENHRQNPLVSLFRKLSQYREYIEPQQDINREAIVNEREFLNSDKYISDAYLFNSANWLGIAKETIEWNKKYDDYKRNIVSPQLLNRIFTRMFFTMVNIDSDDSYQSLGQKMNAYILAFLNAILVECSFDNIDNNIIVDNKNIENVFIENISNIDMDNDKYNIFIWFCQCPILRLYMDPCICKIIDFMGDGKKVSLNISLFKYKNIIRNRSIYEKKIDNNNILISNIISALNWIEQYRMNAIKDSDERKKRIIFSLKPYSNDIVMLDWGLPDNMIFSKAEKLGLVLEKATLANEVLNNKINTLNISLSSIRSKAIYIEKEQSDLYQYLCDINIK